MTTISVEFEDLMPDWWDPSNYFAVAASQAPNTTIPSGVVHGARLFNGLANHNQQLARGWSHISHVSTTRDVTAPSGANRYWDAVTSRDIFSAVPHTVSEGSDSLGRRRVYSEANVRARANDFKNYPIFIGETEEGSDWDPLPIYMGHFLDELRIQTTGTFSSTQRKRTRNYYGGWGPDVHTGNPWNSGGSALNVLRPLFQYPASDWATLYPEFYANIPGYYKNQQDNMALSGWYVRPNYSGTVKPYMKLLYELIISKKFLTHVAAGGASGVMMRSDYEHTGYDKEDPTEVMGGHLVSKGTNSISLNEVAAVCFVAWWFGGHVYHWFTSKFGGTNPALRTGEAGDNREYFITSTGSQVGPSPGSTNKIVPSYPYYTGDDYFGNLGPQGTLDFVRVGFDLFLACQATAGGTEKWASFSINSGAYTTLTSDDAEVINAAQQNRGVARIRKSGSNRTVWYWNPIGPNTSQTINVKDPDDSSIIYTGQIFGNKMHVANFLA